ncbi:WYL domain-containing protein [Limnohabitans sp.]|uniref:helix-turn-helix transcriptional regulator n=1 Tax=Limnohabitans sp. TaxID=1907725 RepID=UPI0025B9C4A3|nr:WYL domain-containing protein [Limnohabitans sp.]
MNRAKKPDTFETLSLALEMLRRIPRARKVSTKELHEQLQAAGFERDERSIQRLLKLLSERFGIERDERSLPYGYRWGEREQGFMMPGLNRQESLLLLLAQQQLSHLLPPSVMRSMDGFFKQARANLAPHQNAKLEQEWLHKVRVVSETQPLLPPRLQDGVLDAVSAALYANHWLEVDYTNQKDERKTHRVMPLALVQQGPRLYMVCRFEGYNNQRILALQRINAATDTGLPFERPEDFDLATYEGEGHLAVSNGPRIHLQFDIDKGAGFHLLESPLAEDQNVQFGPEGYTITATVPQTLLLDRWLNSFGGQIRNIRKTAVAA